ncbi:hypothetical protein ACOR62_06800 [Neisseria lisongii]|uniref:Uncharacterized protein n=1 Tax=Neisseria lisongii TaxID=2912188 RepID=A0AAW5AJF2_9NEIS|nr:hypothetical protein [Neisseria lisongii]MCF7529993.1 hypothetical protein [Neisseria lisongii]
MNIGFCPFRNISGFIIVQIAAQKSGWRQIFCQQGRLKMMVAVYRQFIVGSLQKTTALARPAQRERFL